MYREIGATTARDIWLLPLTGDHKPILYLQTPFDESNARFSPDGKWMAYQSDESGHFEIYVQSFPASGTKYPISSSGGTVPHWRLDGKELFYVSPDQKLTAVPVKLGTTVEVGAPQPLFPIPETPLRSFVYAPSNDSERFLVDVPSGVETSGPLLTVVSNWQSGMKK